MSRFLLVFDRSSGELRELREVDGSADVAMAARMDAEERYRQEPAIEVVVLNASSRKDLLTTHARYFQNLDALVRRVAASI